MAQGVESDSAGPFRVVELARVTDEDLAQVMNTMDAEGWTLERIDYIKEVGVRRPQMAFLFFRRDAADPEDTDD